MQIIHFKKFCVPVSTGTSKVDKLLKMPPDSISESVIFQNFPGGMPQTPYCCFLHTMSVNMPESIYSLTCLGSRHINKNSITHLKPW